MIDHRAAALDHTSHAMHAITGDRARYEHDGRDWLGNNPAATYDDDDATADLGAWLRPGAMDTVSDLAFGDYPGPRPRCRTGATRFAGHERCGDQARLHPPARVRACRARTTGVDSVR